MMVCRTTSKENPLNSPAPWWRLGVPTLAAALLGAAETGRAQRPPSTGMAPPTAPTSRVPNELGRIPILEWHLIGDRDGTYRVSRARFRAELELLHARGYVPISLADLLARRIDLPAGRSPVLFTFDDASPGQFRYVERNGRLTIDSTSGVGILLDFIRTHPDWQPRGVFCLLPAADAGHAFFGNKGIDGQQTAWRFPKLRFLVEQGFELCNHTLWHARLDRAGSALVREQLARGALAIDSAVPGYPLRALALPFGLWPRQRALARAGEWHDPKTGRITRYRHAAIFLVTGGPARSPFDPRFDPLALPRVPLQGGTRLQTTLDLMDQPDGPLARYVSDGVPATVARPAAAAAPTVRMRSHSSQRSTARRR